ncbi:hypothetical protein TELCIR_12524 [Teladorsagia circumcincta]|uniref:Uncharacterized protein n=1 Tax=Teladorsagia circumcincta TaxID=45464 RepID=A0A2G9U6I5_TELCI|nr:hypothetical protein TELCIR_12524 [Teladorsagia circumcincta]
MPAASLAKLEQALKDDNLYEKKVKLQQTLKKLQQEETEAFNFVTTVLHNTNGVRLNLYTEDEASDNIKQAWRSLRPYAKSYMTNEFPEIILDFFLMTA